MYAFVECLVIAALTFMLAAGLFLAASIVVLVDAAVGTIATWFLHSILATRRVLETVWTQRPWRTRDGLVVESAIEDPLVNPKAANGMLTD